MLWKPSQTELFIRPFKKQFGQSFKGISKVTGHFYSGIEIGTHWLTEFVLPLGLFHLSPLRRHYRHWNKSPPFAPQEDCQVLQVTRGLVFPASGRTWTDTPQDPELQRSSAPCLVTASAWISPVLHSRETETEGTDRNEYLKSPGD